MKSPQTLRCAGSGIGAGISAYRRLRWMQSVLLKTRLSHSENRMVADGSDVSRLQADIGQKTVSSSIVAPLPTCMFGRSQHRFPAKHPKSGISEARAAIVFGRAAPFFWISHFFKGSCWASSNTVFLMCRVAPNKKLFIKRNNPLSLLQVFDRT